MTGKIEVVPCNLLNLGYELRENGVAAGSIVRTPLQVLEKGTVRTQGRETYLITDASGPIGSIVRESLNSRLMTVELADSASGTPREIVLFMVWVVLLIHDRE